MDREGAREMVRRGKKDAGTGRDNWGEGGV